ncbi:MAG TPA: PKD domain-containing protein [Puia sp.]|nr:PKD domain-containing protein [Puia sp.]
MKKSVLFPAILFIALTTFTNCKKQSVAPTPIADFSYSGAGLAPSTVTFTNSSQNASTYNWNFGDGSNSSEVSPVHTYTQGGNYTVSLTAYDANNNPSNAFTQIITITRPTSAAVTEVTLQSLTYPPSGAVNAYFLITDGTNQLYKTADVTLNELSLPESWQFTQPYTITNFNQNYGLEIYQDNSPFADTQLGIVPIVLSLYTTGASAYPMSISIPSTVDGTAAVVYLKWQ